MNIYWIGALLLVFVVWSGFMYHEGVSKGTDVCNKISDRKELANADATVGAQKAVIDTIAKQQEVTQGVDHDYQATENDIDYIYANVPNRVQQPQPIVTPTTTCAGLSAISNAASRPTAATPRSFRTKVFKLTPQECDQNTAQLYAVQSFIKNQRALYPTATK